MLIFYFNTHEHVRKNLVNCVNLYLVIVKI